MHEAGIQRVFLFPRRSDVACNEDGYDEGIHGQDTGHDDRYERLVESVGHSASGRHTPTFMIRSGR
jgi:hypothetical protein